ncbi:MAG TPA: YcaO-like family protein [Streptosporangiaceae bacterium]|nr:YcaO-like family protein [Streptosporangiaceae bacterium]
MLRLSPASSPVWGLVSRYGITPSARPTGSVLLPDSLAAYSASYGDLNPVIGGMTGGFPGLRTGHRTGNGSGRALGDPERASLVAVAEAAERYATGLLAAAPMIEESAYGLGAEALDLDTVPRCSRRELAAAGCPLRAPAKGLPIRWVKGVCLATRREVWVPAVMACHSLPREELSAGEQFWFQISTGCAIHTSPQHALVAAICEIIERDAIAISWLQRLRLPPLSQGLLSDQAMAAIRWSEQHFITTHLFDATTDLGVPTVYCLQIAPYAQRGAQVVGCATDTTFHAAAETALLEAMTLRAALQLADPAAVDLQAITALTDGAAYMGQPDKASAFDFLTGGSAASSPPVTRGPLPEADDELLHYLVSTLTAHGMRAIAVPATTDELAAAGLSAVRVIIPELQPMSLLPLAQYLGHPRLYDAPRLMGHPSSAEKDLNPWPQPFA